MQHYTVHAYVISMEFSAMNRRRPSRETPLGLGAKKDGCFRRLGLFPIATNDDSLTDASRNCMKFVYCWWAIRVSCADEHLCHVANLNPFQESYLHWRANNLFRESRNDHAKVASRQNNSPMRCQVTFHIICINFQVVFFLRITSENLRPLTHFKKKCSSYIFLLNQGRSIF